MWWPFLFTELNELCKLENLLHHGSQEWCLHQDSKTGCSLLGLPDPTADQNDASTRTPKLGAASWDCLTQQLIRMMPPPGLQNWVQPPGTAWPNSWSFHILSPRTTSANLQQNWFKILRLQVWPTLASCDLLWPPVTLTFDLLTPKVDHYMPSWHWPLVQFAAMSVLSFVKYLVQKSRNRRMGQ